MVVDNVGGGLRFHVRWHCGWMDWNGMEWCGWMDLMEWWTVGAGFFPISLYFRQFFIK